MLPLGTLGWLQNQASASKKVDIDWSKVFQTLPAAAVPNPAQAAAPEPVTPSLPQLCPAQKHDLTCDTEAGATPYSTARKLMERVPLLTVGSSLYIYNGIYYQRLTPAEAQRLIVKERRNDVKLAGTPSFPRAVYDLLLMEPDLAQRGLNVNQRAVSFQNGVLLLDTGEFRPNNPAIVTTYGLQCSYLNGTPASPGFDRFLLQITGGDLELVERIWQMVGYTLTPDTGGKVFFLLQGVPNSGKSVLSSLLSSFFNEGAVSALDVHALSEKFAASELQGKALCLSPDLPSGPLDNKAVSKLKQLTGNDVVSADVKYKDRVQFLCTAKIVLASNHPLLMRERDDAFIERAVVIPFNYATPKERQDPHLLECLKWERDAIATRAIAAYFRLVSRKYRFSGHYVLNGSPALCAQDSGGGIDLASSVHCFLQKCFVPDKEAGIFTGDAHRFFTAQYGAVPVNTFSNLFFDFAYQLYGAEKVRKRKPGETNALSYISGIRLISGK